ncbi:MAG: GNAT family N-acetyltransferase, partial [Deltaproteobacteria bacterium]|nr:GNAT family N-acetyltransferase [Deltaproteobacteria bacterium]
MQIRPAGDDDLDVVMDVESAAFGSDAEADLVRQLLEDPSARPAISLLA